VQINLDTHVNLKKKLKNIYWLDMWLLLKGVSI
jgi:hypothetical protein